MHWLYRNPFHDVARDLAFRPIVEAGRSGVGMAEQVLDVLEGDTLVDKVRSRRGAKRVAAQVRWQTAGLESSLEHRAGLDSVECPVREFTPAIHRAKEGAVLLEGDTGRGQVVMDELFQVVPAGDLAAELSTASVRSAGIGIAFIT